jgi:hypothetical protein
MADASLFLVLEKSVAYFLMMRVCCETCHDINQIGIQQKAPVRNRGHGKVNRVIHPA